MSREKYEEKEKRKNKIILPSIPNYKKDFVKIIGEYLTNKPDSFTKMDFNKASFDLIRALNYRRRISSYGKKIIEYTSKFLDEEINPDELKKAEDILSRGLKELEVYEVGEDALSGHYNLKEYVDIPFLGGVIGGKAPMEGELKEEKPSGFHLFNLSNEDREKYLLSLEKTLWDAHPHLAEGFKSENNDKNFNTLVNSLFSKDEINLVQVITVNSYIRNVRNDAALTCKLAKFFEESGLNRFHRMEGYEKSRALKEADLREISSLKERIFSSPSTNPLLLFSSFVGSAIIGGIAININNLYLFGASFLLPALGAMTSFLYGYPINEVIKNDKMYATKIETHFQN